MATKVRKQVYIEARQDELLKRLASETGLTEAEIIRQCIDRHSPELRQARRSLAAWRAEMEYLRRRQASGPLPGGRTWRRDDAYDQ